MSDKEYMLFIDGEWVQSEGHRTYEDFNPATGEVYARIAWASRNDVARAIEAAYAAKEEWASKSARERAKILHKTASLLEQEQNDLADVLREEAGCPRKTSSIEVSHAAELFRSAGEYCRALVGETYPFPDGKLSFTVRQPVGVVGAICAWSLPLLVPARQMAFALVAGNTVVLRPPAAAPVASLLLGELLQRAGLPDGALNIITAPDDVIDDELLVNPKVNLVALAGEVTAARAACAKAGQHLKRIALDPGHSDTLIVLYDADLDSAVDAVPFGRFGINNIGGERVIIERSIADEFIQRLTAKALSLKIGHPRDPNVHIGPMLNRREVDAVHARVIDAINRGAKLHCGGRYDGLFYQPTVLSGATRDMRILREDSFAPTVAIGTALDVDEAISIANDIAIGRAAIITNNLQKALYAAERLQASYIHISSTSADESPTAHLSLDEVRGIYRGTERELICAMTEIKHVSIQRAQRLIGA